MKPFGKKPIQHEDLLTLRRNGSGLHARVGPFDDVNQTNFSKKIKKKKRKRKTDKVRIHDQYAILTQPAFTCSKLTIEILEQGVKHVQS